MDHENKGKEELVKELNELRQMLGNLELERRESEAYMEAILNAAPVGIGLVKNRVFGWVSRRMSEMLGLTAILLT